MTTCLLIHHVSCRVFWWNFKSPRWLRPLQLRFGILRLLTFPKTKITFERWKISDSWWDVGKYEGAAYGNWENCVRSQGAFFEEDWGIIVLYTMFLVSSSINVSFFILHGWIHSVYTCHKNVLHEYFWKLQIEFKQSNMSRLYWMLMAIFKDC